MIDPYLERLAAKTPRPDFTGLSTVPPLGSHLMRHQRHCVEFGLQLGRFGLFLDTGMGKTLVEHEYGIHAAEASNGRTLILCPLAVAQQQKREAERFGYPARVIRDMDDAGPGLNICNYERHELLRFEEFGALILDEASILCNFTGATSRALRQKSAGHRWRVGAAAVPAPNDAMELGQHCEFLGVMPSNEMLMRWFTSDQTQLGKYRLRGWGELPFWDWMASWSRMAGHPRDLGFPVDGFDLPPLRIIRHQVDSAVQPPEGTLFTIAASATDIHDIKRQTAAGRADLVCSLLADEPDEPWVIWVDTDYEADAVCAALKRLNRDRIIDVRGSMPVSMKEERLERFSTAAEPLWMVSKPSIAGLGLNWQHAARAAFVGRTYSYLQFYQALRRQWRFGQQRPVHAHLAIAEGEEIIGRALDRKAEEHRRMQTQMVAAMGRQREAAARSVIIPYVPKHEATAPDWLGGVAVPCLDSKVGRDFALFHGDCVKVLEALPDNSVDIAVYSPPFSGLYIYSDSLADMGNCANDEEFLATYRFLCEELYRVLRPGRLALVHCKHLVYYQNARGSAGVRDFPGELIRVHQSAGFDLHGPPITVWRCPVREMTKTKAHGLLYKQLRADSTFSRQGLPEYILPLRKWPRTDAEKALVVPVTHTKDNFPLDQWQEWASPVWVSEGLTLDCMPVWGCPALGGQLRETDVLQAQREPQDEKHICPMPLDIIRRCIEMWSNPGEILVSPFGGIGSEPHEALKLGRRAIAVELKGSYFRQSGEYLDGVDRQTTIGDLLASAAPLLEREGRG